MSESKGFQISGFLPTGVAVSFAYDASDPAKLFEEAVAASASLLAAGLLMAAPGLEAGELREAIGSALRKRKKDGTPVIDVYLTNEKTKHRFLQIYLDTPEDIAAFESATGLKLNAMPLFPADRLDRDGSEESREYIVPVKQPVSVVAKHNPRYDAAETDVKKKKPARLFVRWETANAQSGGGGSQQVTETPKNGAGGANSGEPEWDAYTIAALIKAHQSNNNELRAALGIQERWSEWTQGYNAAEQALLTYVESVNKEVVF